MKGIRCRTTVLALAVLAACSIAAGPAALPTAEDDHTFRPTVIVRRGGGQGSGTVIASKPGLTLVLTAAHVIRGDGPVIVEAHRFNMGLEEKTPRDGWPVKLVGEVAAQDVAGDVAVVRVKGRSAMPFVARFVAAGDEPEEGALVVSLGVDGGSRLESWSTHVQEVKWFSMSPARAKPTARGKPTQKPAANQYTAVVDPDDGRPFLITEKAPIPGRSGGGLFLTDGRLVGVCVGRIERPSSKHTRGMFASADTVRKLLRENNLEDAVNAPAAPILRRSRPKP